MLAPIALFTYNRPYHLKQTVESLSNNFLANESCLYVFSDGWKNETDKESVYRVRQYLYGLKGFKQIKIIEASSNQGLALSIIKGVTDLVKEFGKIIVLEDDLLLSRYFLTFMNDALEKFKNIDQVCNVNGHTVLKKFPNSTFLIRHADSWGWGTWDRAWQLFNPDGEYLLKYIRDNKLSYRFDFNNAYHFTQMLEDQVNKKNNSWAIRWKASLFLENKLSVNAGRSLVDNTGCDGSGTHCVFSKFPTTFYDGPLEVHVPAIVEEDPQALKGYHDYYSFHNKKIVSGIRYLHHLLSRL